MNCVAIIPARSGSKGIKDKNLQEIGGHSLIDWSVKAALVTPSISQVIVSTDSDFYAEHARNCGAIVPVLRPKEISLDNSTDFQFIKHMLNYLNSSGELPEYVVHLRPTTPFRDPALLEEAITRYIETKKDFTSLRSVHLDSESAYKATEIDEEGFLATIFTKSRKLDSINNARQCFPKTYTPNGYIDIIDVKFALSEGELHGDMVMPFVTSSAIEIDEPFDLIMARSYFQINTHTQSKLF